MTNKIDTLAAPKQVEKTEKTEKSATNDTADTTPINVTGKVRGNPLPAKLVSAPPIVQGNHLGDLLKYEADNQYSREAVTVAAGQSLALGALVGRRNDSGEVAPFQPDATDGTQTVVGVLLEAIHAHDFPQFSVMVARHAILADNAIDWGDLNPIQQTLARAQLEARGLILRGGV